MANKLRLAMLIDGDNAQASLLTQMLAETSKYGVVTIRRVYGDWTEPQMKGWKQDLHTHAFQPIQQFRYTVGKNATDSAMIIDAMDILYTAGVDGFCLVSSDSDYTRLATRIREKNLFVMGIGKKMTPPSFVNACNVFVYTENLEVHTAPTPEPSKTGTKKASTGAAAAVPAPKLPAFFPLFRTAFEVVAKENGWARMSSFGSTLRQLDPGFDPRTYGFRQLRGLVKSHPQLFEIKQIMKKKKEEGGENIPPTLYMRLIERGK